ncbi:hypothetical protein E2C01_064390 [Portunus trituberculatus]|uniref:Uncharacterized protein n=1 Tax=Portunus trituberculatus TaxID=210409 RepID=A0A5B7HBK2_PORTR|nr:hypothetical protein [Portunus trituberculatus]
MGEDEMVEHIMLECEKDERVEKTGREWMVLLLGLCKGMSVRMIEAVKECLERMWQELPIRRPGSRAILSHLWHQDHIRRDHQPGK